MNAKHYVSLEAAKKLKELGYNEETDYVIDDEVKELMRSWRTNEAIPEEFADYFFSCPPKAEAIDWLDSKGMRINIIYDWIECKWYFTIINGSPTVKNITELKVSDSVFYKTRLEAEEAAIIKALDMQLE